MKGEPVKDPRPLLAYAYELQAGDEVDGHTIFSVDDPHRPKHSGPAWSDGTPGGMRHGDVKIRFDGGSPITCDRLIEFTLLREHAKISNWRAAS